MTSPLPPERLSQSAADLWRSTIDRFELEPHHLRLLELLCRAWDRAEEARQRLDEEGLTVATRDGGMRAHPLCSVERDARLAVCRILRELDLDLEMPASTRVGPPPIFSNRGHHAHVRKS
jgi:P27 family predicted phage terminase small subunit